MLRGVFREFNPFLIPFREVYNLWLAHAHTPIHFLGNRRNPNLDLLTVVRMLSSAYGQEIKNSMNRKCYACTGSAYCFSDSTHTSSNLVVMLIHILEIVKTSAQHISYASIGGGRIEAALQSCLLAVLS